MGDAHQFGGDSHWRCAWCLRWNKPKAVACHDCGRDIELLPGGVR